MKFVRSAVFPTDANDSINFTEGEDGLGKNLRNPQRLNLGDDIVVRIVRSIIIVFHGDGLKYKNATKKSYLAKIHSDPE